MIINQLFYLVFKTSSFSICSLAWCRYCRTSTLHLRFARSCGTPWWSYNLPPSQRPTLLWTACSKVTKKTTKWEISRMHCMRAKTVLDIQARVWHVHSRAPPTIFWWATCAVGEIFVPIQSMSIERNFYPVKILCYTVIYSCSLVCTVGGAWYAPIGHYRRLCSHKLIKWSKSKLVRGERETKPLCCAVLMESSTTSSLNFNLH